jgi:hypothetical protein
LVSSSTHFLHQLLRLSVDSWGDKCGESLTIFRSHSLLVKPLIGGVYCWSQSPSLAVILNAWADAHGPCQLKDSGIDWNSMQGSVAMTDRFYGKCFSKRAGSENGEYRLGRDNVIIHRLREPYANRGALHISSLATEAGLSVIADTFAHAMLDVRTKSGGSSEQVWRAKVSTR